MNTLAIISAIIIALFDMAGQAQASTDLNKADWYYCDWYIESPERFMQYNGHLGALVAKDSDGLVRYVGMAIDNQSVGEFHSYGLNEWTNTLTVFVTIPESETYTVEGYCELAPL